jgi:hypothetical protein
MLPLFGFEGMVWKDEARTVPLAGEYYIRCVNKRNKMWDADALGIEDGAFATEGHFSLCLADLKGNDAVKAGDEIEFFIFKKPYNEVRLCNLGSHIVTAQDMKVAGVAIEFVAGEEL